MNKNLKLTKEKLLEILWEYSEWLHKKGYIDTDFYTEEPNAVDWYLKEYIKKDTNSNKLKYHLKDIPIKEVLELQNKWSENNHNNISPNPSVYEILEEKYGSQKLVYKKMEWLNRKGYLEYGVSLRTAWLTEKGKNLINTKIDKK